MVNKKTVKIWIIPIIGIALILVGLGALLWAYWSLIPFAIQMMILIVLGVFLLILFVPDDGGY